MWAKRATRILNLERSLWFLLCVCCVTIEAPKSTNHAPRAAITHTVMRLSAQEKKIVPAVTDVDELVVVPARAVYLGSDFAKAAEDPGDWALERDQTSSEGYVRSLVEHIEIGVREAARNPHAVLVFSGGKSIDAGAVMTRASSYWQVARANDWFGVDAKVESRTFTEEHANDGFEHALFSVCRFFQLARKFPSKITVVGFHVERARFEKLHLDAMGYSWSNMTYIGTAAVNENELATREAKACDAFARDPYGCRNDVGSTGQALDPFNERTSYSSTVKSLKSFWTYLDACPRRRFTGRFPWSPGVALI